MPRLVGVEGLQVLLRRRRPAPSSRRGRRSSGCRSWSASYSLSSTVTFGLAAWKPSARVLNSGVVARLQPASVSVTGPVGAAVRAYRRRRCIRRVTTRPRGDAQPPPRSNASSVSFTRPGPPSGAIAGPPPRGCVRGDREVRSHAVGPVDSGEDVLPGQVEHRAAGLWAGRRRRCRVRRASRPRRRERPGRSSQGTAPGCPSGPASSWTATPAVSGSGRSEPSGATVTVTTGRGRSRRRHRVPRSCGPSPATGQPPMRSREPRGRLRRRCRRRATRRSSQARARGRRP